MTTMTTGQIAYLQAAVAAMAAFRAYVREVERIAAEDPGFLGTPSFAEALEAAHAAIAADLEARFPPEVRLAAARAALQRLPPPSGVQ